MIRATGINATKKYLNTKDILFTSALFLSIKAAKKRIKSTLANSDGWNVKDPTLIQRLAPQVSPPTPINIVEASPAIITR